MRMPTIWPVPNACARVCHWLLLLLSRYLNNDMRRKSLRTSIHCLLYKSKLLVFVYERWKAPSDGSDHEHEHPLSVPWRKILAASDLDRWRTNELIKTFNILNFQFVSHPFSQLLLNSEIYRDVSFLEKSSWKQFALILLAFGLFPFFLVFWLVFDNFLPKHRVGRMLHSPCVKFLINCGSFQTFLFLLFLSSFAFQSIFLQYAITGE